MHVLSILSLFFSSYFFQSEGIHIKKTANFEVTGSGSNVDWKHAPWIPMGQQLKQGISAETKVKMLYSETGLYILYHCEDAAITSTLTEDHADLWEEDVVEFFIWTDQRYPLYFEYELSPNNVELVLLVPNIDDKFLGWIPWHYTDDRKVQHATAISEDAGGAVQSWTAEIFLPYELLSPLGHVPAEKGTTWYMNFYRIDYDQGMSTWAWKPVTGTFHQPEKFGAVVFD